MPSSREESGYEKRVEEGSDIAFRHLGDPYFNHQTGSFKPDHDSRVLAVRHMLRELGMPKSVIDDSIAMGETWIIAQAQQARLDATKSQARMGRPIDA